MVNPTQADYEKLARTLLMAQDRDDDEWEDLGFDDGESCITITRETLDDFRAAAKQWQEPGRCLEVNGGLYWARCQAIKGKPRCELCIVDCGDFRLIYQA